MGKVKDTDMKMTRLGGGKHTYTQTQVEIHIVINTGRDVWFGFTNLVKERPLDKNNAKLVPSLLKKDDGSRERKKKRKVGQKDCSAAHQRQMDYFFIL